MANVIKKIKTNNNSEASRIGANAGDIDYQNNDSYNSRKTLIEVIGTDLKDETLSQRISNNENNILNIITLNNNQAQQILILQNENIEMIRNLQDLTERLQNLENLQTQQAKTKLISQIFWDTAGGRNLRDILGPIENMPTSSIRSWLERLQQKLLNIDTTNVWHSIVNNDLIPPGGDDHIYFEDQNNNYEP